MADLTNQSVENRAPAFAWTRRHTLVLAVLCLAALLDTIDVTVVNVAMPAIRNALHFSEGGLAWMVDAYTVPFGGLLLLGGRAGDLLGRRRVLAGGTAVFAVASLGSALAPSAALIIVTRAAEGAAAAFVVPMTLAMLSSVFPAGPARNRAFSVWGSVSAAAGTLGLVGAAERQPPARRRGRPRGDLDGRGDLRCPFGPRRARRAGRAHGRLPRRVRGQRRGVAAGAVAAAALLREDGRGERVSLIELQTGE